MSSYIDLNKKEVKILLSGLHNLILDEGIIDYLRGLDEQVPKTIEGLIYKFEGVFQG